MNTPAELENAVGEFARVLQGAKRSVATTITIDPYRDRLDEAVQQDIREKNRRRRLWQRNRDVNAKIEMVRLQRQIRTAINTARNRKWGDKLEALNPQDNSLWKLTRALRNARETIPALTGINGRTAITESQKANGLADYFVDIHNNHLPDNNLEQDRMENDINQLLGHDIQLTRREFTKVMTNPSEVAGIVRTLPGNKAPGKDGIEYKLLKYLPRKGIVQLTYLINAILRLQHWPSQWKCAVVVPILKPNKNAKIAGSYRPISLLSAISKLVEKVFLIRLDTAQDELHIDDECQFGFRKGRGTVQQVARIVNDVKVQYNLGKHTTMVLLDIEKAFDTVWIPGLLYKLNTLDFPTHIIKLVRSFLTGRSLQVRVNNKLSTRRDIRAGVPQGSCLSPKLYNLYVSDFPEFPNTKLAKYADDTAMYAHSHNAQAANMLLRAHMARAMEYYDRWKIRVNAEKSEAIVFTRRFTENKILTPITMGGRQIPTKRCVKYLGVRLDQRLTFNTHVNETIRTVYSMSRSLYPLMARGSRLNRQNKKLLYTMVIRPAITYAAPVWCSIPKTTMKKLKVLEHKFMRLVSNSDRYTSLRDLYARCNDITPLADYVQHISQKFYEFKLGGSPLTRDITRIRQHNAPFRIKHLLPYQALPIFRQPL